MSAASDEAATSELAAGVGLLDAAAAIEHRGRDPLNAGCLCLQDLTVGNRARRGTCARKLGGITDLHNQDGLCAL